VVEEHLICNATNFGADEGVEDVMVGPANAVEVARVDCQYSIDE